MSYITTYTGKHFDPMNPDASLFDVRDFAHALSLICRGNGHVKTFFSVGEHCVNCCKEAIARGCSRRVSLACLLHDASEAYLSDVPRPFKNQVSTYVECEERLLGKIYERYLGGALTAEEQKLVKAIDDDMLYYDLRELLGETMDGPEPEIHIELNYEFVEFSQVEREYLELYEQLK